MKIAILTVGTRGDVQPFIALGKKLKARGHDVVLAAPENFGSWIEQHGLAFHSLGVDMQAFIQSSEGRKILAGSVFTLFRHWRKTIIPLTRNILDASWHAAQDADVIIYHPKAGGAVDIAEITGAATLCAIPIPIFPTGHRPFFAFPGSFGATLNRLSYAILGFSRLVFVPLMNKWRRETLGLGKVPFLSSASGGYNQTVSQLCAVSPTVLPHFYDDEHDCYLTGYWFLDEGENWTVDPALKRFLEAGSAPVYIGFGSMTTRDPGQLVTTIVDAARKTNIRILLATGWGGLAETDVPDTVHIIKDAPHDALFKHVCAVVHHGGSGSIAAGLRAGLPTLVCPLALDQPFWGRQIYSLGCGPKPQPLKKLQVDRFAEGLIDLTTTPSYRNRAVQIAEALTKEDGTGNAVRLIEAAGADIKGN